MTDADGPTASQSSAHAVVPATTTTTQTRTRSYAKEFPDGLEVQGSILIADGWTRHTRVYGGGVCQACLEAEQRASLSSGQTALQEG